jgi:preprotein translocase SecE subunit
VSEKGKQAMSTAVTTASNPEESKAARQAAEAPARSRFQVHKPGEGYATRLGMMVVVFAYVLFACYHWYYFWKSLRDVLPGFMTNWTWSPTAERAVSYGGAALIGLGASLFGYYYIYIKRESAEFLIKTDSELGKVTWPKISPWFRTETQVWGATYVVLLVCLGLTIYVFGVDYILQWLAQQVFYGRH